MDQENKKQEITTISELAEMINNGFQSAQDNVNERFDKVEVRLDKVEIRLEKVEVRLDKVESRLGKVEKKLDVFIDDYHEEKLPMRVEYIENVLDIPKSNTPKNV
jgi:hypothetical protein